MKYEFQNVPICFRKTNDANEQSQMFEKEAQLQEPKRKQYLCVALKS
jgi:hypothetical protein